MGIINDFWKENNHKWNIFLVYITEAHAADVWPIGESAGTINYKHQNISDRLVCVEKLIKEYNVDVPVYADNMENEFETKFAAWPFRYFVSQEQTILKISEPIDSEVDITELFDFLKNY